MPAQPGSSHHSGSATDKVFIPTGRFMPCVLLFPIWQQVGRQAGALSATSLGVLKRGGVSHGALGSAQEGRWRADPQAHISFDPRQSHVWRTTPGP